jgi:hypothetical protein
VLVQQLLVAAEELVQILAAHIVTPLHVLRMHEWAQVDSSSSVSKDTGSFMMGRTEKA